ncbi:MAG TPA: hypothetical protein VHX88_09545 [Solirubrobacteraceae bacterium]|nr:hypothetical protein [Solirubrobacteraceae bacterium]
MPNRRPRLELHAPGASPAQAAAIVAAVERFLRDHTPPRHAGPAPTDPWRRTALLEGVEHGPAGLDRWGDAGHWGG